eukprot:39177-Chlamydomonas_euryale.AAC.1
MQALAATVDGGRDDRPILLSEYAHSMGNSAGNLHEYWMTFESHPSLVGGFIWDWRDQCLLASVPRPDASFADLQVWHV